VRASSTLALLAALTSGAAAQAFGRFGYAEGATLPGIRVSRNGFAAVHPLADEIKFGAPLSAWKPLETSEFGQTVGFGLTPGNPNKGRFDLLTPGFALYYPQGLKLRVGSTAAPYLSWSAGSVTNGVPAPAAKWLVLSFRDAQPPLVLGFPDGPVSLAVNGKPGDWTIESAPEFKGWLRVGLPVGSRGEAANSAAALGRLTKAANHNARMWTNLAPTVTAPKVEADEQSVTATWTFSGPDAVVPEGLALADIGGYRVRVLSPIRRAGLSLEGLPLQVCEGRELKVRFPLRRVPIGRSLPLGGELTQPIATISHLDVPSVGELALECLLANRDLDSRKTAEGAAALFLSEAAYHKEPFTEQQLPFDAEGKGIDLAAAHALLSQSLISTTRASSESNALLTSVAWRRDWYTWRLHTPDPALARRAGALAALAGALCPEPERRLSAAMFQAGLSAEHGRQVALRRSGQIKAEAALLEPLLGIRQGLFRLRGKAEEGSQFADLIVSPLRVFSEGAALLVRREPDYVLQWTAREPKASVLTLASGFPITVEGLLNLPRLSIEQALGITELAYTPETTGLCEVRLKLPEWVRLPATVPTPRYSEPARPAPGLG